MKRWAPWFLVVAGLCALLFAGRTESPSLLEDTDTVALLTRLREVRDPMAWFKGDWPLQNHFYRPISTLTFEWDLAHSGAGAAGFGSAAQYGATNALLAIACVLLLFWFLREATDVSWLAGTATALFAVWHFGERPFQVVAIGVAWLAPLCLLGLLRGGKEKLVSCLLAAVACVFLSEQLQPVGDFSSRIVHWLPGRTASVMAVFALASLAGYARYVRLSSVFFPLRARAEDVPATKSNVLARGKGSITLLLFSFLCVALALGSYEQAVMLPALLFGVWLLFTLRGLRSAWWPHLVFWALLGAYLALRHTLVPGGASAYQEQQFRSGPGVSISIGDYLAPCIYWSIVGLTSLSAGWLLLITTTFWQPLIASLGNLAAYWSAWRDRQWKWTIVGFFLLSFFAFLPMAWLQPFGHYHYLPSAFRACYVVLLAAVVARLVFSAASLPELRAPARRGPAPGSLLRP